MLTNAKVTMRVPPEPEKSVLVEDFLDRYQKYLKGSAKDRPELLTYNPSTNVFKYTTPQRYESIPTVSKILNIVIQSSKTRTTTKRVASTSKLLVKNNKLITALPVASLFAVRNAEVVMIKDGKAELFPIVRVEEIKLTEEPPKKRGRKKKELQSTIRLANSPIAPEGTVEQANVPQGPKTSEHKAEIVIPAKPLPVETVLSNYRFETSDGSLFVVDELVMK